MSKFDLKKLGKNIRDIRKSKNLSQEKLAELIKKTRNYIGMIERAEINIPASVIFDIAKALNVSPKVFLILSFNNVSYMNILISIYSLLFKYATK